MKKMLLLGSFRSNHYSLPLLSILFFFLMTCQEKINNQPAPPPAQVGSYEAVVCHSDSVVLNWTPPENSNDTISYYELLYRVFSDSGWSILKTGILATSSPSVAISRSDITSRDSIFLFAVRAVTTDSIRSDLRMSSDTSALQSKGWCLVWGS